MDNRTGKPKLKWEKLNADSNQIAFRLNPLAAAIRLAAITSGVVLIAAPAYAELPVPVHTGHLTGTPADIATLGHATASISGNALTVNQLTDKTRIDWQSFNIGANNSVRFNQPGATSVALNNIHQADPSRILGKLTANGQVYLVNQNGFVFGKDSQINANSLVATTLGISDGVLQKGLASAFAENGSAALQGTGETFLKDNQGKFVLDQNGNKVKIQIFIEAGAKIKTTGTGGRIIIAAPVVTNAGTIQTPDGQTIVAAAKDKVYLQEAGNDSGIRGLLVEVGTGGKVDNIGKVLAERGNVSLMGFAVNQNGIVSATSSVNLNGSVRLIAREGIQDPNGTGGKLLPKATIRTTALDDGLGMKASVHLGKGSITSVNLDSDKTATAFDLQKKSPSLIELYGHDVSLSKQSLVQAKSGKVNVSAVDNPSDITEKGNARIFMESGSVIDVSGVKDVALSMDRNVVTVELRKNELKDSPLQREGILFGQKVKVDLRYAKLNYDPETGELVSATIPVADIKGAVERIGRNIDERSTAGGTVEFKSSGDVVTQTGSLVDFSGGSVKYNDGYIETTKLVANGKLFDIGEADPNLHYDSIFGQIVLGHPNWGFNESWTIPALAGKHFEAGFTEGKAAGSFTVSAYESLLNGSLDGSSIVGGFQRSPDQRADTGHYSIDLANNNLLGLQDVVFDSQARVKDIGKDDLIARSDDNVNPAALVINPGLIKSSGIGHLTILTNGHVKIDKNARIELPENGSLDIAATGFDVQGGIKTPSGEVSLKPMDNLPTAITLGESATIDVSGLWVNDFLDGKLNRPLGTIASDGGKVTLTSEQADLNLHAGSVINVSGGAHIDKSGKVHDGNGGSISLIAAAHDTVGSSANLKIDGELTGYGLSQGGSLSLASSEVAIGTVADNTNGENSNISPLLLNPEFFRSGGFADYSVTSNVVGLKVADHTHLNPQQKNLVLAGNYLNAATGSNIRAISDIATLPLAARNPTNLSLSFSQLLTQNWNEALTIGQDAVITTDPGGSVKLASDTSIYINGTISTPGGAIAVNIEPPASVDKGFFPSQGIWLGAGSRLLAQGAFKPEFNQLGLKTGDVLAGGTVSLTAKRGYIVTDEASLIDVSGTQEKLDFQRSEGSRSLIAKETVTSDGGAILFRAGEGILADGALQAKSGGGESADGSLSVELSRNLRSKPTIPISGGLFPDDITKNIPQSIIISDLGTPIIPTGLAQGGAISSAKFSGKAFFNSDQINSAGFDSLAFKTDVLGANGKYAGTIQFNGNVGLTADRQIILDSPTLKTNGGQITLNTSYAVLGSSKSRIDKDLGGGKFSTTLVPNSVTGKGRMTVTANNIDLVGGLSFNGFNHVNLSSHGDVRTIGIRARSDNKDFLGELRLDGDLTITASQVYPATLTDYLFNIGGKPTNTITIAGNGEAQAPVYSAGGSMTLKAPQIVQKGVLKAPFGTLNLVAQNRVVLTSGSVTSVSGGGLTIPFGQGSGGLNWLYPLDSAGNNNILIDSPLEKRINLTGKTIALKNGAKVDLSGGGDLYAYEFISGLGGSVDVLDPNNPAFTEKYAVIPSLGKALTPYDPLEFPASGLHVGDSVYLSGGSGLKAGWYALLPAHYALLPGAYLVAPQSGTQDRQPGQTSVDPSGAVIVAGRYGVASAGTVDSRWQGFAVAPGSSARVRSQYTDYLANAFFINKALKEGSAIPALPRDAGSLALNAISGLSLGAQLLAAPANGGLGGQVDISGNRLAIVGRKEDIKANTSGLITLLDDDLNRLNAPSLLLGGTRSKSKTGQTATVSAKNITVAGNAELKGSEILLAAQDKLQVKSGAVIASTGKSNTQSQDVLIRNQDSNTDDGAFLRVSSYGQADVVRNNAVGKAGQLIVEKGATVASGHSMLLDSTKSTLFDGTLAMQGGSLALNANKISLGKAPGDTTGLVIRDLNFTLDELKLKSASDIGIYGSAALKSGSLIFDTAQISGFGSDDQIATITADNINLTHSGANAVSADGTGTGTLTMSAKKISLGSGDYAISGFKQVNLNANESIKGLGQVLDSGTGKSSLSEPGKLTVAGNLTMTAGHFIGDAGATTSVDVSGHNLALNSNGLTKSQSGGGLGASWSFQADTISGNGRFDLPSGHLELSAKDNINLNDGFIADVSGRAISFGNTITASSSGNIKLSSESAAITLAEGATLNLAGAAYNGQQISDAGVLSVEAKQGRFDWNGSITALNNAQAKASLKQGSFTLAAENLGNSGLSGLNNKLAAAGFSERLELSQGQGDLKLGENDTIKAHQLVLTAEHGKVTLDGAIDASGAKGGQVAIYGHDGITLGKQANIIASAKDKNQNGGSVKLDTVHQDDTGSGLLDLSQGGKIDVSGGTEGKGGFVHFRTGRDDQQHAIAVTSINTDIIGAESNRTVLEATRVYDGQSVINQANINAWKADTAAFMNAAPTVNSLDPVTLLPGLEIRSEGDLTLASQWNLMAWRYKDAVSNPTLPGFLTLRAEGNLNVKASLTDAFKTGSLPGQPFFQYQDVLQPGLSWSYDLIAGNDINLSPTYSAPDPFDPFGGKVNTQVMVRTGTGAIDMAAGGNINFVGQDSHKKAAAAVYTMGTPALYTRSQLLGGLVPGVPAKLSGESDADYLNRLDPNQLNELLRYGYFNEQLLGIVFRVAEYPTQGGSINIKAGGDINGINTGQQINDWLVRSGSITDNNRPTAWGININGDGIGTELINGIFTKGSHFFNQNIGALGGGDVAIAAGGNITNLSAMLPTTGKPFGKLGTENNQWLATGTVVNGGGNLTVQAGHDIAGGEYYVGRGHAEIQAGGSVTSAKGLGALLELGEGSVSVNARQNVEIGAVFNPTVLPQENVLPAGAGGESLFFTYKDDSAVQLNAIAGNIVLQNDTNAIQQAKGIDTSVSSGFQYAVYPGSLSATATSGDINIENSFTLFPSAKGELSLLANNSIGTDDNSAQLININMSDADPAFLSSPDAPAQALEGSLSDGLIRTKERLDPSTPLPALIHAAIPLHLFDPLKPSIIAKLGDISFASNSDVSFFLPQAADISAGRDINNLSLFGQNLLSKDITKIDAGRDIVYDAVINDNGIVQANDKQIELGGPGQLQITAGRNINLGSSAGINTIGNTKNSVLPSGEGADINLLAGISGKIDYNGFIDKYFQLKSIYLKQLFEDLKKISNDPSLTPEKVVALLKDLPDSVKQSFLLNIMFHEIKQSTSAAAAALESQRKGLYQRGFDAISALFPDKTYKGDLSLVFSQIKTLAGGGINIAVPGGAVDVGLAGKNGGISKGADQLGIVVQKAGDLNAVSLGNFNVNQSRVFTMGGGDIAIWSSEGNIDAGKGAKSAISAPPPITIVDAKGNIVTVFPPIVSGSGIQTINPQDGSNKQGNVYLAAPAGVVDAGEASISGGNVVIAATAVIGASNISASGVSVGVPTTVAPPAVPAGAASAAASAAKSATQTSADEKDKADDSTSKKPAKVSIITADVVGYGDCSVTDVDQGKQGCGG